MVGATIVAVRRRAKVLLIELDSQYTLVVHLKMTGQLVYRGSSRFGGGHPNDSLVGDLPDQSTRVTVTFHDGSQLFFNDQRKFGWMKLIPTPEVPNIDFMKKVGPEPLEDSFTAEQFIPRIRRRNNTTIKAALLDQTVLAGVGNIYADEGLWGAKIHPATRVKNVSDEALGELLKELKFVMNLSIEKGGSTDRNYVNAEGKRGSYIDFARVFRKERTPCPRHPDAAVEKTRVAGRGTHVCPLCQVLQ
jgi:formamidopyrimidine-DNA glycosylase